MEAGQDGLGQDRRPDRRVRRGRAEAERQDFGRRARRDREGRVPDLRKLLGHVHGQQHELPGRGDRPGTARQRHHPGHLGRPQVALRTAAHRIVAMASEFARPGPAMAFCRARSPRPAAFDNAMILDMAMGGSTNTVLHILAIAHEAGVPFSLERIDELSKKTPNLCKVSPSSRYHIEDVARAGGIHTILGEVARGCPGLLDLSCMTVTGKTLGENIDEFDVRSAASSADGPALVRRSVPAASGPVRPGPSPASRRGPLAGRRAGPARRRRRRRRRVAAPDGNGDSSGNGSAATMALTPYDVIRTVDNAYSKTGGLTMLSGNLAPEGAVVKTAGVKPEDAQAHRAGRDLRERDRRLQRHRLRQGQAGRRRRHPLRRPQGRPGHAGDARPNHGDQGRRSGRQAVPSSPTAASRAAPPAPRSATSAPRPPSAVRSACCKTATSSRSTSPLASLGPPLRRRACRPPLCLETPPRPLHHRLAGSLRQDGHERRYRGNSGLGTVSSSLCEADCLTDL